MGSKSGEIALGKKVLKDLVQGTGCDADNKSGKQIILSDTSLSSLYALCAQPVDSILICEVYAICCIVCRSATLLHEGSEA